MRWQPRAYSFIFFFFCKVFYFFFLRSIRTRARTMKEKLKTTLLIHHYIISLAALLITDGTVFFLFFFIALILYTRTTALIYDYERKKIMYPVVGLRIRWPQHDEIIIIIIAPRPDHEYTLCTRQIIYIYI